MAHHATDVHQWLSATCALLDEDTPLWVSPEDDLAGGGLLVSLNGDTYYMPPDTARKLDDTMSEENISGQTLLEKIWSNVVRWLEENSVDDPPVSPGSWLEEWLQDEEHKFLGLDLEYTADCRDVAVVQLCFKKNVMVFQWASSDKHCPKLMEFLRSGIYFASVDITNDRIKMMRTWGIEIPAECHIDFQSRFRLKLDKTSMADMTAALIDEDYADMNKTFPKSAHKLWEKTPLDPINIDYAAIDGYVAYELYRKIRIFNYGQCHLVPLVPASVPHWSSPSWGYSDPDEE